MARKRYARITDDDIQKIVQLRGLGFTQGDISKRLDIPWGTIQYHLARLRREAKKAGDLDAFFWEILLGKTTKGLLGWVLKKKH